MRRISVRGIVWHEEKLLCVKLKPYRGVSELMAANWCTPGGGLDDNEPLLAGIEREMIEETGIKPVVGKLLYLQQFMFRENDYLEFFFHIKNAQDYTSIDLSKTTHGETEIESIGFVDPKHTPILPEFLMTEDIQRQIDHESTPKIFSLYK